LWDHIIPKVIINKDVIFTYNKLKRYQGSDVIFTNNELKRDEGSDNISKEMTIIQINEKSKAYYCTTHVHVVFLYRER